MFYTLNVLYVYNVKHITHLLNINFAYCLNHLLHLLIQITTSSKQGCVHTVPDIKHAVAPGANS